MLPPLAAVLVNPGVAVPTKDVFAALRLAKAWRANAADQRSAERRQRCSTRLRNGRNDLEGAGDRACSP